jgi:phosphoribosyl 1,2-cyclic phosphodiesterase
MEISRGSGDFAPSAPGRRRDIMTVGSPGGERLRESLESGPQQKCPKTLGVPACMAALTTWSSSGLRDATPKSPCNWTLPYASISVVIAISLQSGSSGNSIYVEAGGARLLFDAGICGVQAARRLAAFGRDIRDVDALVISHDHADHVRCAGVYQRKYGLPLYITSRTLDASLHRHRLGRLGEVNFFPSGGTIELGGASVLTVPTPHDGTEGVAFVVVSGGKRLGILTDLGHVFDGLLPLVSSLDAVFMESNYDPEMLARGPYPAFLKRRIKGPEGHISNTEAAELLHAAPGLKWACLSHLSENNNDPALALRTHRRVLGGGLPLYAASRTAPTGVFTL